MEFRYIGTEERNWSVGDHSTWVWPAGENGLWNIRHELGEEQIPTIMQYVKERNTCVQAGGALGMAPLIYSNHFKTVYTFEPNSRNFYFLNRNVMRDNVIKINAILGEKHGLAGIGENTTETNRGIFRVESEGIIPTFRVDDLCLKSCDLIHLDMEGYEEYALRGAKMTIDRFSPVIVGEGIGGREPCTSFLEMMGYKFVKNVASDAIYVRE